MSNAEICSQIQEDLEIYGPSWRSSPVFEFRRIMCEKGLRNIDIAERLGVSEANVSRMLRGDQNLKIETLNLLAAAVQEKLELHFGSSGGGFSIDKEVYEFECAENTSTWAEFFDLRNLAMNDSKYASVEVDNESVVAFG